MEAMPSQGTSTGGRSGRPAKTTWTSASSAPHLREVGAGEHQAKWALYLAIKGQASRLVVASMNPDSDPYNGMTYAQYLLKMGEKFSPAA